MELMQKWSLLSCIWNHLLSTDMIVTTGIGFAREWRGGSIVCNLTRSLKSLFIIILNSVLPEHFKNYFHCFYGFFVWMPSRETSCEVGGHINLNMIYKIGILLWMEDAGYIALSSGTLRNSPCYWDNSESIAFEKWCKVSPKSPDVFWSILVERIQIQIINTKIN